MTIPSADPKWRRSVPRPPERPGDVADLQNPTCGFTPSPFGSSRSHAPTMSAVLMASSPRVRVVPRRVV
jgi:hypothetical protein